MKGRHAIRHYWNKRPWRAYCGFLISEIRRVQETIYHTNVTRDARSRHNGADATFTCSGCFSAIGARRGVADSDSPFWCDAMAAAPLLSVWGCRAPSHNGHRSAPLFPPEIALWAFFILKWSVPDGSSSSPPQCLWF
jgi:hypothetical protein